MNVFVLKSKFMDCMDRMSLVLARYNEIKKYKDPRRMSIYRNMKLSNWQKAEIDKFYIDNYGEKIPYYWHQHFSSYTGKFDVAYFPELLFIPEFERFMNGDMHYVKAFEDKSLLPIVAKSIGVEMPHTLFSVVNGLYRDFDNQVISIEQAAELLCKEGQGFIKPTIGSSSGKNCRLIRIANGRDADTGEDIRALLAMQGNNYIAQKCLSCHFSIKDVYPNSVNTFRIITYIWKGHVEHMPLIMRVGQGGSYLDNAHAGGMFIAISDEGEMHEKAFTEFREEFTQHPDTGTVFKGHIIDNVPKVIEAAKKMHRALPQIGCVNWDFTINAEGNPVLIEGNMRGGSIWLIEMAHGCGAFGERTPEVLQWLRMCKSLPKSKRAKYAYGHLRTE